MPSPYYPFKSLTGRGCDTFLCRIKCKKARIWTFLWLDRKQYGWFALLQLPKMPLSVSFVDFSLHFCLRNEQWILTRVRYKISAGSFFLNLKNAKIEISSIEIFSISSYTKKLRQKFTDHLNAIWYRLQVTEATNGFTFQIHEWNLDLVWL